MNYVAYVDCDNVTLLFGLPGASCFGPGAVGMPLLETWCAALHVLPHPSSTEAMDQGKQGDIPEGTLWSKLQTSTKE